MVTEPRVLYEFGPFRVDPEKQLLLREDHPVVITPKAFETLLALIRHSREVVSKDELMKAVWPDAFVEEGNLSQNIFVLRKALGDTPEDRRYIVTIPGRGYRFAVEVHTVTEESEPVVIASHSRSQVVIEQTESVPSETPPVLSRALYQKAVRKYLPAVGGALGLMILGAGLFFFRRQPALQGERNTVLIADFSNTTGDPVFDDTLRQGLEVQLGQSPFLSLVSQDRVQRTLRLMGEPLDAPFTPRLARQACERIGSAAVLEGSIASLGSQYVVGLRATNCRTGDVLDQEQAQAAKKEDVLSALSQIASRFRARVGESLATVKRYDTPLAEATTPSLEALKAYSLGLKVIASQAESAAIPFFLRAIKIDPKFAIAYAYLGIMYGTMGETGLAVKNAGKAYELRDRASDNEKFFVTAYYEGRATGNQEKARATCEAWAKTYPRELAPHSFLSGFIYPELARHESAIDEANKIIDLAPDNGPAYVFLGYANLYLGRLQDAEDAIRRASEQKIDNSFLSFLKYDTAFLKNDTAGMEQEVADSQGKSGTEEWIAEHQAFALAYSGHMQEARKVSRRASALAQQAGAQERVALFETRAALREAFVGNASEATQRARAALAIARNREVNFGVAFALALAGETSRPESLANDLENSFPEDTSVRFYYLPAVRGQIALNQGQPARSIELLQWALPYEFGLPRSGLNAFFGTLYPGFVRSQAYLAAHQGAEAAAEAQKILNHGGIVVADPIGAVARLQLGRAFALSGDRAKAKTAYQDFLTLWKDADPDIPILKQAKSEYARLQ